MPRHENRTTPKVLSGHVYTDDVYTGTPLDSPAWFAWLNTAATFYYQGRSGTFTARLERRHRGGQYWIAYSRQAGVLRRCHLGKAHQLTADRLERVALTFSTSSHLKGGHPTRAASDN